MATLSGDRAALVNDLAISPAQGDLFVGKLRGFPVGLKFVESDGSLLLLFQVRHPLLVGANETASVQFGEEIARLIEEQKIAIEFEDKLIWVTFVDGGDYLENGTAKGLLEQILSALERAGLAAQPDICHYCGRNKVDSLTCSDGKVAQICPIVPYLWLIPALPLLAAGETGAKRRQKVAHGVSRGTEIKNSPSPGGV